MLLDFSLAQFSPSFGRRVVIAFLREIFKSFSNLYSNDKMPETLRISDMRNLKNTLDREFLDYFQKTVETFFENYTGRMISGYFSTESGYTKNYEDTIKMKLALQVHMTLDERKPSEVIGNVILDEGCLYDKLDIMSEPRKSDRYNIQISPNHTFSVRIPMTKHSILPSRMIDHYKSIYYALYLALKPIIITKPTRFIPTNEDTVIKLKASGVKDVVRDRLQSMGYEYWSENTCKVASPETQILVNPLSGRILGENGITEIELDRRPVIGHVSFENVSSVLRNLKERLLFVEKEVLIAISEINSTEPYEIKEIERVKQMVLKSGNSS